MTQPPDINHHFRRESKLMVGWLIGIPLCLVLLAGLLGPYLLAPSNPTKAMTEQEFWTLIEQAKGPGGEPEHAQRLAQALVQRTPQEVIAFQLLFEQFRDQAEVGDVWAAGLLLNGGHGTDSGFEYFRYWLIGQGQAVYRRALSDADSLAELADRIADHPDERAEWESYGAAPYYAYRALTQSDMYDAMPPAERKGFPERTWNWQDYTDAVLEQRLPRLWARFGEDKQASDRAVQEAIDSYEGPESLEVKGLGKVSLGDTLIHKDFGPGRIKALFANDGVHIAAMVVFADHQSYMLLTSIDPDNPLWSRAAP